MNNENNKINETENAPQTNLPDNTEGAQQAEEVVINTPEETAAVEPVMEKAEDSVNVSEEITSLDAPEASAEETASASKEFFMKAPMDLSGEGVGKTAAKDANDEAIEEIVEEVLHKPTAEEPTDVPLTVEEAQKEFIEEFAPDSIVIPNYNKEKEQIKMDKAKARTKKQNSSKNKKRREIIGKIVNVTRTIFLFALLLVTIAGTLAAVVVRTNTSDYSIKEAVLKGEPERFVVGKIDHPEKIMLRESSDRACVADILRDNSVIPVSYEEIEWAVQQSSYPSFIADVSGRVVNYLIYGKPFEEVSKDEIIDVFRENATWIELITGQRLGDSSWSNLADYIKNSPVSGEINEESLAKQPAAQSMYMTSVLFSLPVLLALIVIMIILLVLIVVSCKGYAHRMIGWSMMIAGAIVGAYGYFFRPKFTAISEFVKSVVNALTKNFNESALIYGVILFVAGLVVVLVGSALSDDDDEEDDDEDEEESDYIDEIEQDIVSKRQADLSEDNNTEEIGK